MKQLNIGACLTRAGRAFAAWWIPLCLLAGVLLVTQTWVPGWLIGAHADALAPYRDAYEKLMDDSRAHPGKIDAHVSEFLLTIDDLTRDPYVRDALRGMILRVILVVSIVFILVAFLQLAMVVVSKASVQRPEERTLRKNARQCLLLTLSYMLLAFVKITPFLWCILPGVYLYVRLYFTGFLITDTSPDPIRAMADSWRMTQGNFWRIFVLFLLQTAITLFSMVTIIGFIPGSSFNYTLRAAAYDQLRKRE